MNNDNTGSFYALLFRMKSIERWSLMSCMSRENLSEHSLETAFLAHALAILGVTKLGKVYSPEKIAAAAMYHDMSEILTGDMPTPVKYYNDEIKAAYKQIEKVAEDKLYSLMNDSFKTYYKSLLDLTNEEKLIIKAADKLSAYVKCQSELKAGNGEFRTAAQTTYAALKSFNCEELKCFMDNYLSVFSRDLDKVTI